MLNYQFSLLARHVLSYQRVQGVERNHLGTSRDKGRQPQGPAPIEDKPGKLAPLKLKVRNQQPQQG